MKLIAIIKTDICDKSTVYIVIFIIHAKVNQILPLRLVISITLNFRELQRMKFNVYFVSHFSDDARTREDEYIS